MARIIPNDFIKGITGKVCEHSDSYYSMNSTSGKIYTGKRCNPYTGPATETQLAQQAKFKAKALAATAWLNANKPDPTDSTDKGTDLYQEAQSLKKDLQYSNVRQVLYKYMDKDTNVIKLPSEGGTANSDSSSDSGSTTTKYTVSLAASPSNGGTVSGAGSYTAGSTANISAVANSGYTFSQWSDGNTSASRSVTVNSALNLTAVFTAVTTPSEDGGEGDGDEENPNGTI